MVPPGDHMSNPGGDVILRLENLTKSFRGFVAVNDISLDVRRSTIHALIGPNGAGKTTVFNLLTKFLPPTSGRIYFKDRDITDLKPEELVVVDAADQRITVQLLSDDGTDACKEAPLAERSFRGRALTLQL